MIKAVTINKSIKFFLLSTVYFSLLGCGSSNIDNSTNNNNQQTIILYEDENTTLTVDENNTETEIISTETEDNTSTEVVLTNPNNTLSYGPELLRHAGNENGPLQEKWQGSFHMLREHQDKQFLLAGNEAWSYIYQDFPTKIGKRYDVKATLIGADQSRRGNFEGGSIVAIADTKPISYKNSEIIQSQSITGAELKDINFTFIATSNTSYVVLRGDTRYRYPNLYSLSIKEIITNNNDNITETEATEVDNIKPIITLKGDPYILLTIGDNYHDAGATANDNKDGDITNKIQTRSNVDTSKVGNYTVTYSVTDAAGNTASNVVRRVEVKTETTEVDNIKPIITLKGDPYILLTVGDNYHDAGATANDNKDGDITNKIQTRSNVDTSKVGNYTVTYSVTDEAGNTASNVVRRVEVKTQNQPIPNIKFPWDHGKLKISANKRMLQHEDGTGFFWLGDTAWQMTLKLKKDDIAYYFEKRKEEGFTVSLITIESWRGMKNPYGEVSFNSFYSNPNEAFWEYIDYIIEEARKNGIYIALLPSWGEVLKDTRGANTYGKWVASRYKNKKNIIWVVGGDQSADSSQKKEIFNAIGNAINSIVGSNQLITYHPSGTRSSGDWFKNERWLDFNMIQSGHCINANEVLSSIFNIKYNADQSRPILDGESRYETIEECFYKSDRSGHRFNARDVRDMAYKEVFSGAFGHTYGHQSVWTMYKNGDTVTTGGTPIKTWKEGMDDPGAHQMKYLKKLIESRPIVSRVPDQSIVVNNNGIATRGDGYLFVYLPNGGNITVNFGKISGTNVKAWWYDPTTGDATEIGRYANNGTHTFTTGADDMVLVIDDISKEYGVPGL